MFNEIFRFFFWLPLQNGINQAFVLVMVALFAWDRATLNKQHHVDFKGVITVTGILGTFVGVFFGLSKFEINAPEASILRLLDGLKIAFFTSVVGMALSIILGVMHIHARSKKKGLQEFLSGEFAEIKRVLSEDLPQQIQQGAIEQIVAQLEIVVKDFNNKLNEQFGENFKRLNEACEKLLQWQEAHTEELGKTKQSIEASRNAIEKSMQAIKECETALSDFVDKYKKIQFIFKALDDQTNNWVVVLSNLNLLVMNAQKKINEIKEVTDSLSGFSEGLKKDLTAIAGSMKTNVDKSHATLEQVKETQEKIATALKDMENTFVNITKGLSGSYNKFKEGVEEIFDLAKEFKQKKTNDQGMSAHNE